MIRNLATFALCTYLLFAVIRVERAMLLTGRTSIPHGHKLAANTPPDEIEFHNAVHMAFWVYFAGVIVIIVSVWWIIHLKQQTGLAHFIPLIIAVFSLFIACYRNYFDYLAD